MAQSLVVYGAIHQPLPLRLPAIPVPQNAEPQDLEQCLFDLRAAEVAFCDLVGPAYDAAAAGLRTLAESGLPLSLSVSSGFLHMSERWTPELLDSIACLLRSPAVEPVAAEPTDGLLFAFDITRFMQTMASARDHLAALSRRPVAVAEVSGFSINHEIYHALGRLSFDALFVEGAGRVNGGRHPAHLSRFGRGPLLARRLQWLSDELSYHLRSGLPDASRMCDTIAHMPGDVAVVDFTFDSLAFGHDKPERGLEALAALAHGCRERGVQPLTVSAAGQRCARRAADYPPPVFTATSGLAVEEFERDGWTERLLFGRMQQAYRTSQMADGHAANGMGEWLLQRVNLSLPTLADHPEHRPPTYWPVDWWASNPGYSDTAQQVVALYDNFIRSAAWHADKEVLQ